MPGNCEGARCSEASTSDDIALTAHTLSSVRSGNWLSSPIEDHFGGNPGAADPSLDDRDGLGIGSLRLRLRTTRSWILACTSAASLA